MASPDAALLDSPPAIDCSGWQESLSVLVEKLQPQDVESPDVSYRFAELGRRLPRGLGQVLRQFRDQGNTSGAVWLRGLPRFRTMAADPAEDRQKTAALGGILASAFGSLIGYAQIDQGRRIRDVIPTREEANKQSAKSSRSPLELHTEQHFHPYCPHHVLLLCLRGQPDAVTTTVGVQELLATLGSNEIAELEKCQFRTGLDYVFGNSRQQKGNGPVVSVLSEGHGVPALRYDADLMIGNTAAANAALAVLGRRAKQMMRGAALAPGEALVIDNEHACHGRSAFTARFDGQDRWLLQLKTRRWLPQSGPHRSPESAVLSTEF